MLQSLSVGLQNYLSPVILWLSVWRNGLDYDQLCHLQDSRGQNLLLLQVKELSGHAASRHILTVERKELIAQPSHEIIRTLPYLSLTLALSKGRDK